ncbi:DUF4192 family protein [Microbacterium rhizomatis]|uniref:DUF4192 family protein n=1 Tax=Microbacterium rhizomatis TaxID=1631477 RepID=A0A5J5IY26_9MICO|nr:DUF4192 family protein [Microbacterium rhizomatis]KAA9106522.1 DUF4192 family protein [Microbacterium rhizomatis]
MTTIVKAADAAQFLSLVPRMLGYAPRRSLVLIPFAKSRSLGAMRVDLPAHDADDAAAATFIGMVCRIPSADAVAAVVYTEAAFGAGGMPEEEFVRGVLRRADACGLTVSDALCVGADAWGSYLDDSLPPGGRRLALLDDAPAIAAGVPEPVGDQWSGAELPPAEPAEKERVSRALEALVAAVELVCGTESAPSGGSVGRSPWRAKTPRGEDPPGAESGGEERRIDPAALAAVCDLDDLPTLFEDALLWDTGALGAYSTALLIWCFARPAVRDIALVQWCGDLEDGDEALTAQLRWEAGEEYPAHLAMHMWGEGVQPDPGRLEKALELARRAAAAAPGEQGAGALATCAWLSWALGRSTHAERYAAHACELEPEHGLAEIVRSFVLAGHLPDWAFRGSRE